MENTLENKLGMYEKLQEFFINHTGDTSAIPAVAVLKTEFDGLVSKILTSAGISDTDITGYTVLKGNKRAELEKACLKISTALFAQARMVGKPQEAEKWDLTASMLGTMRDNDLLVYTQQVNTTAAVPATLALLAPYAVLPADNTNLGTKAAEFLAVIQEPRYRIGERGAELGNLTHLFDLADDLLNIRLDAVMTVFSVSNPTLYTAYQNNRGIDGTGAITEPDYKGDVPTSTLMLIAKIPFMASRTFIIKNTGTVPLIFGLGTGPNAIDSTTVTIDAGKEVQRLSSNIGTKGDCILINNGDVALPGMYELRINE
jgi:hypothetical protein